MELWSRHIETSCWSARTAEIKTRLSWLWLHWWGLAHWDILLILMLWQADRAWSQNKLLAMELSKTSCSMELKKPWLVENQVPSNNRQDGLLAEIVWSSLLTWRSQGGSFVYGSCLWMSCNLHLSNMLQWRWNTTVSVGVGNRLGDLATSLSRASSTRRCLWESTIWEMGTSLLTSLKLEASPFLDKVAGAMLSAKTMSGMTIDLVLEISM